MPSYPKTRPRRNLVQPFSTPHNSSWYSAHNRRPGAGTFFRNVRNVGLGFEGGRRDDPTPHEPPANKGDATIRGSGYSHTS